MSSNPLIPDLIDAVAYGIFFPSNTIELYNLDKDRKQQ
jgi:hypothetical protein